jgi:serine/threonine protein kinase
MARFMLETSKTKEILVAFRVVDERFAVDLSSARAGGMGKVYQARDLQTGKLCAVKVLDNLRRGSALHELAMQRELDALKDLSYQHIVQFVAHGMDEELGRYIVMDWLSRDLEASCSAAPFVSWDSFWNSVGDPILNALCYAFTRNRVHRDLKPSNVMFDDKDDAKLIDFGISGTVEGIGIGMTLRQHKSDIYSPPEEAPKDSIRDVYGFAATATYALTGIEFNSREHMLAQFDVVAWPEGVRQALASCLEPDSDDRPSNVIVLRERLERAIATLHDSNSTVGRPKQLIFIRLLPRVEQQLRASSSTAPITTVVNALNASTFVERPKMDAKSEGDRLSLVTAELTLIVKVERENPSVLLVLAAHDTRPTHWSFAQERSLLADVHFREAGGVGRVEESERAINMLFQALATHEASTDSSDDQSVFEVWRTVLRGRADYYGRRYPTLIVRAIRVEGTRISVTLNEPPDQNLLGLSYFVEDGINRVAFGEVESVQDDGLTLYCNADFYAREVAEAGRLRYNAAGTERAIKHQEVALDRIQSGDVPNPMLATLVSDPSTAHAPATVMYEPIVKNIDADKQRAVSAALGSDGLFLVVGPPGTGKTEFITELVLQEVQRNPDIRILLCAQTHMAVDNALARIKQTRPSLSCVRLGRPNDRIARESSELLLEKVATDWRGKVSERALLSLDRYSNALGVDVGLLRAQRLARRAYSARQEVERCRNRARSVTEKLASLRETQATKTPSSSSVEVDELEERMLSAREELATLELRMAEADSEVWKNGQHATTILESLLQTASPDANHINTASEHVDAVLAVVSEWLQRLTLAREFFPAILAESQVVAGTCLGFIGVPGTSEITYDLAIIEEASRALPTEVLVPASRASRIVLVGDRRQLPPFLESDLLGSEWLEANSLTRAEVEETLFARFEARLPESAVARLRVQYRMQPAIGDLVGHVFYPGLLESAETAGESAVSLRQLGMDHNVLLVSTSRETDRKEDPQGSGYANPCEVRIVRRILANILKSARKKKREKLSIVLLTPYVANRQALEQAIAGVRSSYRHADVSVHTVHTFQGRQADIAIYSCVRSNSSSDLGFTRDPRLLNVALSRGRGGLIIVGDLSFLGGKESSAAYRDVLTYARSNPATCSIKDAKHVN